MDKDDRTVGANPGYALGQLARALSASEEQEDPSVLERARRKVQAWTQVFSGMLSGKLRVGSRTPVAGTPGWATLKVMTGGFATGELLAGGPLREHEVALLDRLGLPTEDAGRTALNAHALTEQGLAELQEVLRSGCYRVEVPEEGALLVVAWLAGHGHRDAAREVLDAIGPFFPQLRFYPVPAALPLSPRSVVHVQTVGDTLTELQHLREQQRVLSQREALRVWNPMLDRIVALFSETVVGEAPEVALDAEGRPQRRPDGSWPLSGGWPCQQYPAGWQERARACLDDFHRLRGEHRLCGKPDREKAHLGRLHGYLQRCVSDPRALTGRDVGMIRMILAHIASRRGLPGSPRCSALREEQAHAVALPTKKELSAVVIERLGGRQKEEGLDEIEPLLLPVTAEEAARLHLPAARPLPPGFRAPLLRCLDAPIEQLVELGVVPSGEVLARVVPQLTAQVGAAGVSDPDLRRLYGAIYEAFRRRRSLLLLNLQHQVRMDELPWVAAIAPFRSENASTRAVARTALADLATLALTAFPQAILPNKLLREVRALAERADLRLPIVDEIAADIFMGEFTDKYLRAAQRAGELLMGSLYETYYDISYERVCRIDDVGKSRHGAPTSLAFARLCTERAGESTEGRGGWGRGMVARNGKIIEQEQILTTHNLAVLVGGLGLGAALSPRFPQLARSCFTWLCRQQQLPITDWRPRLHMVKNTAYAWRQMIFYLSLAPGSVSDFLGWANGHLGEQSPGFQERFRPALSGLARAARGESPEAPPEARRFLGWVTGPHWAGGQG